MAGRHKRRIGVIQDPPHNATCPVCGNAAPTPHPICLRKRAEALFDQTIRKQLTDYASPIDITPEQALLSLVREAAGNVAWLGARIQQLVDDSPRRGDSNAVVVQGTVTRTTGLGSLGGYDQGDLLFGPKVDIDRNGIEHIIGEEYRGMVILYNEERDRLRLCAKDAISAGILKSQVDLAQYQAEQMVRIFNRVLDKMQLGEAKEIIMREMLAQEFREQGREPVPVT